jgi:hypothetical protein
MDGVAPLNESAWIDIKGDELTFEYDHKVIFQGQANHDLNKIQTQVCNFTDEGKTNQAILFYSYDYKKKIRISGTIYASE